MLEKFSYPNLSRHLSPLFLNFSHPDPAVYSTNTGGGGVIITGKNDNNSNPLFLRSLSSSSNATVSAASMQTATDATMDRVSSSSSSAASTTFGGSSSVTAVSEGYAVIAARPTQMWFADVADGRVLKTLNFASAINKARAGLTPSLYIPTVSKNIFKNPNHRYRSDVDDVDLVISAAVSAAAIGNFKRNDDAAKVSVNPSEAEDSVSVLSFGSGGRVGGAGDGSSAAVSGGGGGGGGAKKFEFGPLVPCVDGSMAVSWNEDSVVVIDAYHKCFAGEMGGFHFTEG